jgi:hypothetical protein
MEFKQQNSQLALDELLGNKDWEVGDVRYLVYKETLQGFGKNQSTVHIFNDGSVDAAGVFSYSEERLIGQWGCHVLDGNLENVEPGTAVRISLKETPKGKKYFNYSVDVGEKVY